MQNVHRSVLDDVLALAALERPSWPTRSAAIPSWHPRLEGDGGDGGAGGGDGGSGSGSGAGAGGAAGGAGAAGTETITLSKADYDAQQAAIAAANKTARDAEKRAEAAAKKQAEEAGNFKTLYEEEKKRNEERDAKDADRARRDAVKTVAARLNFIDPTDAIARVDLEKIDPDNPAAIEAALTKVAAEATHLVSTPRPGQLPGAGGGRGNGNGGGGDGNSSMNDAIRRAAGRA